MIATRTRTPARALDPGHRRGSSSPPCVGILAWIGALALGAPALEAGDKGFANVPGGGAEDPRIEVWVSIGPNIGGVVAPNDKDVGDVCGNYTFSALNGEMVTEHRPPTMPPVPNGFNQFLSIRFPFKISGGKARKSLLCPEASAAATSFLCSNLRVTDENGVHVPGIATINGEDAFGTDRSTEAGFPIWLKGNGKNRLVHKRVFTYVADDGDQSLTTTSAFAPGPGGASFAKELRVHLHGVAGIVIDGFWVIQVDSLQPTPALEVKQVSPTLDLGGLVDGALAVSPKTDFLLELSSPVTPMSVGVGKSWVKGWNASHGGEDVAFHGNVDLFVHPGNGAPVHPNLVLLSRPGTVHQTSLPFDVRLVTPNDLASYRVRPIGKLPEGPLELRALAISQNLNPNPAGGFVYSAMRTLYDTPYDQVGAFATWSFHVGQ